MLHRNESELTTAKWKNINECHKYNAEQKEPDTMEHISIISLT